LLGRGAGPESETRILRGGRDGGARLGEHVRRGVGRDLSLGALVDRECASQSRVAGGELEAVLRGPARVHARRDLSRGDAGTSRIDRGDDIVKG
ncbi:hypothetical protein, partial [Pseudomonas sp. AB12(2023)]|uniref:hypothetical protein n=1 Tax=Pseudomonas sp. AB12(2023) TaxID=3048597 RepID=UPI002B23E4A2